jgi:hypothetical protein
MPNKSSVLCVALLAFAASPALAQTAPGAPESNQTIPEKQSAPLEPKQPDADVKTGRSLSQKLDASGGVIKPQNDIDPDIKKPAPVPNPNSTPVITPGPEAK